MAKIKNTRYKGQSQVLSLNIDSNSDEGTYQKVFLSLKSTTLLVFFRNNFFFINNGDLNNSFIIILYDI